MLFEAIDNAIHVREIASKVVAHMERELDLERSRDIDSQVSEPAITTTVFHRVSKLPNKLGDVAFWIGSVIDFDESFKSSRLIPKAGTALKKAFGN
jgi:hypothetical protein